MHDRNRRLNVALGGLALALLVACGAPVRPLPEGPLETPECGYVEAKKATEEARADYREAQDAGAKRGRVEQLRRRKETAEDRRQDAQDCEERARARSDLLAQQQAARAALSAAQSASIAIALTIGEIVALLATIGVGVLAILQTRSISRRELNLLKGQVDDSRADAREQADRFRATTRPWVRVSQVTLESYVIQPLPSDPENPNPPGVRRRPVQIQSFVSVINNGASVAHRVRYGVESVRHGAINSHAELRDFARRAASKRTKLGDYTGSTLFVGEGEQSNFIFTHVPNLGVDSTGIVATGAIVAWVSYTSLDTEIEHITAVEMFVMTTWRPEGGINPAADQISVPTERIHRLSQRRIAE